MRSAVCLEDVGVVSSTKAEVASDWQSCEIRHLVSQHGCRSGCSAPDVCC